MVRSGSGGDGKSIAQQMNFNSDTLALLQQWYAVHRPDRGAEVLTGSGADLAHYLAKTRDAKEHSVREPLQKIFFVRLRPSAAATAAPPVLLAVRKPHGAIPRHAEFGTLQVLDAAGAVVRQTRFDTDDPYRLECPLAGRPGDVFKVVITDDLRSVWSLFDAAAVGQPSDGALSIVVATGPGFAIGGVGRSRYHFLVPEGTRQFCVKIRAGHNGPYAGVVIAPSGQIAGFHQGVNFGSAAAAKPKTAADPHPERGVICVKPDARETGQVWSLVLTAVGDIYCELQGVPPYLSLTADAWFPADKR
jgi:hypothetical protein